MASAPATGPPVRWRGMLAMNRVSVRTITSGLSQSAQVLRSVSGPPSSRAMTAPQAGQGTAYWRSAAVADDICLMPPVS